VHISATCSFNFWASVLHYFLRAFKFGTQIANWIDWFVWFLRLYLKHFVLDKLICGTLIFFPTLKLFIEINSEGKYFKTTLPVCTISICIPDLQAVGKMFWECQRIMAHWIWHQNSRWRPFPWKLQNGFKKMFLPTKKTSKQI